MSFAPEWFFCEETQRPFAATHTTCVHLHGPPRSGKTSLLFHLAFYFAQRRQRCSFVCNRSKLYATPPLLRKSMACSSQETLSHIQFNYVEQPAHLLNYLLAIEESDDGNELPEVIIVDDFLSLFQSNQDPIPLQRQSIFHALAMLCNTIRWIRERKRNSNAVVVLCNSHSQNLDPIICNLNRYIWISHSARISCVDDTAHLFHLNFYPTIIASPLRIPFEEFVAVYMLETDCLTLKEFSLVEAGEATQADSVKIENSQS